MDIYVLKDASGNILSFGTTSFIPAPGETVTVIEDDPLDTNPDAMKDYAERCMVTADKATMLTGETATITVATNQVVPNITLRADAVDPSSGDLLATDTHLVTITDGAGTFEVTCDNAARLVILPNDQTLYAAVGNGSATIEVTL